MASTISVSAGLGTGKISKSADSSGVLKLTSGGVDVVTIDGSQVVSFNQHFNVPSGTTAQRPSSPVNGMLRYNTTIPQLEIYINGWVSVP
jgi:hypothetical protein